MFIIKLGGSVITDKTREDSYRSDVVNNLSKQIYKAKKQTILIHGAGSFGHILAKKYSLNNGYKNSNQIIGFSMTHEKVQELNSLFLKTLHKNKIPAVSIPPHVLLKLNNHKLSNFDFNIFKDYLEMKFIPVTFGDVVLDEKLGFSICSGDLLMEVLASEFKPEKAVFVIDEDGLYTSNPKSDKNAKLIESLSIKEFERLSTSLDSHADVTGGMGGKLETIKKIAEKGIDTILVNGNKPDRLYKILIGKESKSTIIHGR